jgi:mono/diheme cytochrome c family protein/cytochrome bd-type quinol oxidase subunit 1
MNYPFWNVGIGYGILMATIAVIHVFISHFAIGGGLYLVVSETSARRKGDAILLAFLERLSRFFVLVTVVAGALTGVAIWFIIGLLNPTATEALIHNFVWGWAIEWTFFIIEIIAAILYLYGWKRMSPRDHLTLGWIYFGAAWLSLVIINGIITFMLTPGTWLRTGAFWDGFFNPTYWPSLVLRTGICITLAGLYAILVASRLDEGRERITRYSAIWGLAGIVVAAPAFVWYMKAIPAAIFERAATMYWPLASLTQTYKYAIGIAVLLVVFGIVLPRRNRTALALVIMLAGFAWFGAFEWFRESLRKPFVIDSYMYANATELLHEADYRRDGYLAHIRYRTGNAGADLFLHACGSCHTIDGYRGLARSFDGTDRQFIANLVRDTEKMRGSMPPFMGTRSEAEQIASWVWDRVEHRPLADLTGLSGVALGKKVYEVRCGNCHVIGGFNDKWPTLQGMSAADYGAILDSAGDFSPLMPPFTGPPQERDALIAYFASLNGESR